MAEVITRFRVNCNGVEQDAQYCYNNLANKPTFKTINGKAIIVSSGDTETNFDVATQTDFTALANRVANLEQNGTGSGSGTSEDYDDTEVRNLITAEQNRATTKEASLEAAIDEVKQTQNTLRADFNGFTEYAENNYAKVGDLGNVANNLSVTNNAVENLEARVETLENSSGSSSGSEESADLSNYYQKTETYSQEEVDDKLADKLDQTMFTDFARSVESTYSTKTDFNGLEARVEELEAGGGTSESVDLSNINPTTDYLINTNGFYTISKNGVRTLALSSSMSSTLTHQNFMEFFRTELFGLGSIAAGSGNYAEIYGKLCGRGRFLFDPYFNNDDTHDNLVQYIVNNTGLEEADFDSMIVEAIGGQATVAECTLIAELYTKSAECYKIQICATDSGSYVSNGWQKVYTKNEIAELIDEKIAAALAAIPVAEGGAY